MFTTISILCLFLVASATVVDEDKGGSEGSCAFAVEVIGTPNTKDYRMFFRNAEGQVISPFHDIPLYADEENKIYHMVVEIPKGTTEKMRIATEEQLNPIKQEVNIYKGKLRRIKESGYNWSYGALPQTWQDPDHKHLSDKYNGDNDPVDVVDISSRDYPRGSVIKVKILGALAVIDKNEMDWKLLAIDVTDPLAEQLNDIEDVTRHTTVLTEMTEELKTIPKFTVAFEGKPQNRDKAQEVVKKAHELWKELVKSTGTHKLCRTSTTINDSPHMITAVEAEGKVSEKAAESSDIPALPSEEKTEVSEGSSSKRKKSIVEIEGPGTASQVEDQQIEKKQKKDGK